MVSVSPDVDREGPMRARSDRWSQLVGLLEPFTQNRPHDAPDSHEHLSSDRPIDSIVATSRNR
jgi:hypothetical protein